MSAQQHRERQRQRVDTLEDCLRLRDNEIAKLEKQVASLTERNTELTERVLQLESVGGESETQQQQQRQQQTNADSSPAHAAAPAAAAVAAVAAAASTDTATGSFCCEHAAAAFKLASSSSAAEGVSASTARGKGGGAYDASDTGGVTTEDQAHSSSSESDSDDLSPMSTLDKRSNHPATPPLSPSNATGGGAMAMASVVAGGIAGSFAVTDELLEFSLSACGTTAGAATTGTGGVWTGGDVMMDGEEEEEEAASPPLARSFSTVAAAVAAIDDAGPAVGVGEAAAGAGAAAPPPPRLAETLSAMEFSVPDGVMAADSAQAQPPTGSGVSSASGLLAFEAAGGGGGGSGAGAAEGLVPFGDHPAAADGMGCCSEEDELTMAALDPMEIDALLACAGGDGEDCVKDPFDTTNGSSRGIVIDGCGGSSNGGGGASPCELEAGNNTGVQANAAAEAATASSSSSSRNKRGHGNDHLQHQQHQQQRDVVVAPGRLHAPPSRNSGTPPTSSQASGSYPPSSSVAAAAAASVASFRGGGSGGLPSGDNGRGGGGGAGGGGVASTVAAGVMGALCLAGVVLNSGTTTAPGGGTGTGRALVPAHKNSPPSVITSRGGGARVLSAAGDDDDEDGEYANATEPQPWVFHPVEAEPWRWRATAARERRGPWVWERALNLFGNAGFGNDHPRGDNDAGCHEDVVGVYAKRTGRPSYTPIAPPPAISNPIDEDVQQQQQQQLSGKELDLFYNLDNNADTAGDGGIAGYASRSPGGGGGGQRGQGGRHGPTATAAAAGGSRGVGAGAGLPSDRTSFVFCPEAHGMMSGGMIERASKATYDYHHPGARPCPAGRGGEGGVPQDRDSEFHGGAGEVKVNVINPRRERLRLLAADTQVQPHAEDPHAAVDAAEYLALVSSSNANMDVDGGGEIYFGSAGDEGGAAFGEGVDDSNRPRRRGPAPMHHRGPSGAASPQRGFHAGGGDYLQSPSSDSEFLTMLVPSSALDWGPSTLAVRASLNGTGDGDGGGRATGGSSSSSSSWVEIDCQILSARLVQDVSFLD
ncbi:unnamed protein product [Ectocarpus sp. 13 AM-2016]